MKTLFSILGRTLVSSPVGLVAGGALMAFGWIFGEHVATKIIDRVESPSKSEPDPTDAQVKTS